MLSLLASHLQIDMKVRHNVRRLSAILLLLVSTPCTWAQTVFNTASFYQPEMKWRPVPLWFWNNDQVQAPALQDQLTNLIGKDCYGGCAILPFGDSFRPQYLSEEYFTLYGQAIKLASELGAHMSVYDEYGFPSGSMGAINGNGVERFKRNHPGHTIKRLDKYEFATKPGSTFTRRFTQQGKVMAVVAMDKTTKEVVPLSQYMTDDKSLTWEVPTEGNWEVMLFVCVEDGDPNVDYLSAESVRLFVEDTHGQYFKHFPEAFGTTITSTFFDEPTLYRAGGRIWTEGFNQRFEQLHGCSPEAYYPALWYDLGPRTPAIRNMLFGTRAIMYAEGFMKTIADWAVSHGIESTGHQDQEEVANPVSVAGDLMLDGKYMTMPGIDMIGGGRPTTDFYKVVSSSANNWDKPLVMSETYGAMGNIPMETMYNIAIEQYTKGVNHLIPHAAWYNTGNVTFLPELSYRNPLYRDYLPAFNRFLSRLNFILARPARHVADIAVLYPIQTLQAGHYLDGPKGYMQGGVDVPGTDYNVVSRILTDQLGADFTYLHPEVLDDRCLVLPEGRLQMQNPVNTETFSTIILPGVKAISLSNMQKVYEAWKAGAHVIFTTQKPQQCADFKGTDDDIQQMVEQMLSSAVNAARFVASPSQSSLGEALSDVQLDVSFHGGSHPFNYIHKVVDGHHVYYFGNIDNSRTANDIFLHQPLGACSWLDPHTGATVPAELTQREGGTEVSLTLRPNKSMFLIEDDLLEKEEVNVEEAEADNSSYSIDMDVTIDQLSAGVCFAGVNTGTFYMWQINAEDPANPKLRPHRWAGGNVTLLDEVPLKGLLPSGMDWTQPFHLRLLVTGNSYVETYINGTLVDERDGQFRYGLFGFRQDHSDAAGKTEIARFDNIVVRNTAGAVIYETDFSAKTSGFTAGQITGGQLRVVGSMTGHVLSWCRDFNGLNYTVEADVTVVRDDASIVFSSTGEGDYYMWSIFTYGTTRPQLRRHVYTNGVVSFSDVQLGSFTKTRIVGKEVRMKIEVKGTVIKTYINGVLVDTFNDLSSQLAQGNVGLRIDPSGPQLDEAYYDNIVVTDYTRGDTPTVLLSENFENQSPYWFNGGEIKDVDGNHKLWLHGTSLIRLMQETAPDVTDGLQATAAHVVPGSIYTISGLRAADASQRGLYIIDGRKRLVQ